MTTARLIRADQQPPCPEAAHEPPEEGREESEVVREESAPTEGFLVRPRLLVAVAVALLLTGGALAVPSVSSQAVRTQVALSLRRQPDVYVALFFTDPA